MKLMVNALIASVLFFGALLPRGVEVPEHFEPEEMPHDIDRAKEMEREAREEHRKAEERLERLEEEEDPPQKELEEERALLKKSEVDLETARVAEEYLNLKQNDPRRQEVEAEYKEQKEVIEGAKREIEKIFSGEDDGGKGVSHEQREQIERHVKEFTDSQLRRKIQQELDRMLQGKKSGLSPEVAYQDVEGIPDYEAQLEVLSLLEEHLQDRYGADIPKDMKTYAKQIEVRLNQINSFEPDAPMDGNVIDARLHLSKKILKDQAFSVEQIVRSYKYFEGEFPGIEGQAKALNDLRAAVERYSISRGMTPRGREEFSQKVVGYETTVEMGRNFEGYSSGDPKESLSYKTALKDRYAAVTGMTGDYSVQLEHLEALAKDPGVSVDTDLAEKIAHRIDEINGRLQQPRPDKPTDIAKELKLDELIPDDQMRALREEYIKIMVDAPIDVARLQEVVDTVEQYQLDDALEDFVESVEATIDAEKKAKEKKDPIPHDMSKEDGEHIADVLKDGAKAEAGVIAETAGWVAETLTDMFWTQMVAPTGEWLEENFGTPGYVEMMAETPGKFKAANIAETVIGAKDMYVNYGGSKALKVVGIGYNVEGLRSTLDTVATGDYDQIVKDGAAQIDSALGVVEKVGKTLKPVKDFAGDIGSKLTKMADEAEDARLGEQVKVISEYERTKAFIDAERGRVVEVPKDAPWYKRVKDTFVDFFTSVKERLSTYFEGKTNPIIEATDRYDASRKSLLNEIGVDEDQLRKEGLTDAQVAKKVEVETLNALKDATKKDKVKELLEKQAEDAKALGDAYKEVVAAFAGERGNQQFLVEAFDAVEAGDYKGDLPVGTMVQSYVQLVEMKAGYLDAMQEALDQVTRDMSDFPDKRVTQQMARFSEVIAGQRVKDIRDYHDVLDGLDQSIAKHKQSLQEAIRENYAGKGTDTGVPDDGGF